MVAGGTALPEFRPLRKFGRSCGRRRCGRLRDRACRGGIELGDRSSGDLGRGRCRRLALVARCRIAAARECRATRLWPLAGRRTAPGGAACRRTALSGKPRVVFACSDTRRAGRGQLQLPQCRRRPSGWILRRALLARRVPLKHRGNAARRRAPRARSQRRRARPTSQGRRTAYAGCGALRSRPGLGTKRLPRRTSFSGPRLATPSRRHIRTGPRPHSRETDFARPSTGATQRTRRPV